MSPIYLLQQFAPGITAGALIAFCVAMVGRFVRANWVGHLAFAVAAGGGYTVGHGISVGRPAFPPGDATHWLFFAALMAIVTGLVYGISRERWAIGGVASFAATLLGALLLLLVPKFKYGWTLGQGALWLAALGSAGVCTAWAIDGAVRNKARRFPLLSFLVILAGTSVALAISGSMMLGQLAAVLSAVIFGLSGASAFGAVGRPAIVPALATLFIGLIACGYFYAELPMSSAVLLVIAPATSQLLRDEPSFRRELLRAVIAAFPVAAALVLAFRASPPAEY